MTDAAPPTDPPPDPPPAAPEAAGIEPPPPKPAAPPVPRAAAPSPLEALTHPGAAGVRTLHTACLVTLALLGVAAAMYLLRDVLVPFVMALFLSLLVGPLTNAMVWRLKWRRPFAVAATFAVAFVLLLLALAAVVPAVAQVSDLSTEYADRLRVLIDRALTYFNVQDRDALNRSVGTYLLPYATTFARSAGLNLFAAVSGGLLVGIFLLFLLLDRGDKPVPPDSLRGQIERRIQGYLAVTVVVSALTGLLVWLTLWLLGVPLAWLFGVLAFVLNFVPNIGSVVATLLPLPVVILDPNLGVAAKVLAFVIPAAVQFGVGNVLAPKLMGEALGLSPVAVLLGLIFFGTIWGLPGLLLATPMLAVIQIVFERVPTLAPLAAALGGRATVEAS